MIVFSENFREKYSVKCKLHICKRPTKRARKDQGEHFNDTLVILQLWWQLKIPRDEKLEILEVFFSGPVYVTIIFLSLIEFEAKVLSEPSHNRLVNCVQSDWAALVRGGLIDWRRRDGGWGSDDNERSLAIEISFLSLTLKDLFFLLRHRMFT